MFLGHFAVAYAAKPLARRTSLGVLFLASQLPDLAWPLLLLAGIETVRIAPGDTAVTPLEFVSYPYSHGLAAALVAGAALGGLVFAARRDRRGAVVAAALVPVHWVLDLLSHRPDLHLAPGVATRVGLGLWRSLPATMAVELGLFGLGLGLYLRVTRARGRTGTVATWGLAGVLLALYAASLFGPPPPSVTAVAVAGNATWLLVLWAWWADRRREVTG